MRPPVSTVKNCRKPFPGFPRICPPLSSKSSKYTERVSEARQPIFFSGGPSRIPGVPASAIKTQIPRSSSPSMMRAVKVISPALPALVQNIFWPLMTYLSLCFTARVAVAPASLPAPGSVSPNAPNISPLASLGRYFFFCSSVPNIRIGIVPRLVCAPMVMAVLASATASSCTAMVKATVSMPAPPYFAGIGTPISPSSAICLTNPSGNFPSRSCCSATGATSLRAKSRTISRSNVCSSVKYILPNLSFIDGHHFNRAAAQVNPDPNAANTT